MPVGWRFTIQLADKRVAQDILQNRHELNLSVVETSPDQPVLKWWYYSKEGDVTYDEQQQTLLIFADIQDGLSIRTIAIDFSLKRKLTPTNSRSHFHIRDRVIFFDTRAMSKH